MHSARWCYQLLFCCNLVGVLQQPAACAAGHQLSLTWLCRMASLAAPGLAFRWKVATSSCRSASLFEHHQHDDKFAGIAFASVPTAVSLLFQDPLMLITFWKISSPVVQLPPQHALRGRLPIAAPERHAYATKPTPFETLERMSFQSHYIDVPEHPGAGRVRYSD